MALKGLTKADIKARIGERHKIHLKSTKYILSTISSSINFFEQKLSTIDIVRTFQVCRAIESIHS